MGNRHIVLKTIGKLTPAPPPKKGRKVKTVKRRKKLVKVKVEKIDGLSPKDVEKIRKAIRQVWSWSHMWNLVRKRCLLPNGFSRCEGCKKRCPKVFVDHIERVGDVDAGFIDRLFCPSSKLQGLCKECHALKTAQERKDAKAAQKLDNDFY
jgi:hypothetical protein